MTFYYVCLGVSLCTKIQHGCHPVPVHGNYLSINIQRQFTSQMIAAQPISYKLKEVGRSIFGSRKSVNMHTIAPPPPCLGSVRLTTY